MRVLKCIIFFVCIVAAGALQTGCGDKSPSTPSRIEVTPTTPAIAKGTSVQMTATAIYGDNSKRDLTSQVDWSVGNSATATVNASGLVTGTAEGATVVSATVQNVSGEANLTVTAATLVTLTVTADHPSIAKGTTTQLAAIGTFTDGRSQNLSGQVSWSAADAAIATVANDGLATGMALGSTSIIATVGDISVSTDLTVTDAVLVSLAITPAAPSIAKGTSLQLTAIGLYTDGSQQDLSALVTWSSTNTSSATVLGSGLATGTEVGIAIINARFGGISANTSLAVTPAVLISLDITPTNPILPTCQQLQFNAIGTFAGDMTQDLSAATTWSSSNNGVATISNATDSGNATTLANGQATITAIDPMSGISSSTNLTVGDILWPTKLFGTNENDWAMSIAADACGNVFVTGDTYGNPEGTVNAGGSDMLVTKYDALGNRQWTRLLGTSAIEEGIDIAVDGSSNVLVSGPTTGGVGGNENVGGIDFYLAKYSGNGSLLWTKQMGSSGDDWPTGLAVDSSGNVYTTGYTDGGLDGNTNANPPLFDSFVVKYDAEGNRLWTRQFGTVSHDTAGDLVVDQYGGIYTVGETAGSMDGYVNAGVSDMFVVKYDADGNKLWTRQFGSPDLDSAWAITSDSLGDVIIAGDTSGSFDGNNKIGNFDIAVVKIDRDGNKKWSRQIGSPDWDRIRSIASDQNGNTYLLGLTLGSLDGQGSTGWPSLFVTKIAADGNQLWLRQISIDAQDDVRDIAVNSSGNIYVTGGTITDLDGNANAGKKDLFVLKFDTDGNRL